MSDDQQAGDEKPVKELFWTTKDGTRIPISHMETSHLENCLRRMERLEAKGKKWRTAYKRAMQVELVRRKLSRQDDGNSRKDPSSINIYNKYSGFSDYYPRIIWKGRGWKIHNE